MMTRFILSCLLLVACQPILAQELTWQHTGGPNGINGRAVEVTTSGSVFVGTFEHGVFFSDDKGETWSAWGLENLHGIYDFAFTEEHVYAATWSGVFVSSLQSPDWVRVVDDDLNSATFSIYVNPSGHIFAALRRIVIRSTNGGTTWTNVSAGLPELDFRTNPDALEANQDGHLFLGTNQGLFVSTDGESWTGTADSLDVESIVFDAEGNIFIGTAGQPTYGVLRSEDGGATWSSANGNLTGTLYVNALALSRNNDLYAGILNSIYRSSDGGTSWTKVPTGLPADIRVFDLDTEGHDTVYAGLRVGIYRSLERGDRWDFVGLPFTDVYALACDAQGNVYAGASNAPLALLPSIAETWNALAFEQDLRMIEVLPDGTLAGGIFREEGLYVSMDEGRSWQRDLPMGVCSSPRSFWTDSGGDMYAATVPVYPAVSQYPKHNSDNCGGVYYLPPADTSWRHLGLADLSVFDGVTGPDSQIVVATEEGPYRSVDGGENWEQYEDDSLRGEHTMALEKSDEDRLYLGSSEGIYISDDFGLSWQRSSEETPQTHDLLIAENGDILAGTSDGMLRSMNQGETWERASDGLGLQPILALCIDTGGFVYAGTEGQGVYRSSEAYPTNIAPRTEIKPVFVDTYPNPSSGSITFSITLPAPSNRVKLVIYDLLGRQVATLLDESGIGTQTHLVVWNAEDLPSGTYYYRAMSDHTQLSGSIVLISGIH